MPDAIAILFEERLNSKEQKDKQDLIKVTKRRNENKILHDFIEKRINPKYKDKLVTLIENYTDALIDSLVEKNETLYRSGFNACLDIILNSKDSK